MPSVQYIQDLYLHAGNNTISSSHFGVNFIAGYNQTVSEGNFENIVQRLGVGHIRYPGGTVTETYFDPMGTVWRDLFEDGDDFSVADDGRVIEGPGRMFDFAERNGLDVTFVLPTDALVSMVNGKPVVNEESVEKVHQLVEDILEGRFGDVTINAFEIGNEYYHYPDMTAEEYSAVANEIILAVDDAIQDYAAHGNPPVDWEAPDIAVQSGVGWKDGDNEAIIDGLSPDALEAVTSVVAHYYSSDLDAATARDQHLGQIDQWEDATGIDNLNYHISEWNVAWGDTGMAQSSTMLSAFDEMLSQGVDTSTIWGAQLRWLESGMSVNLGDDDLEQGESRLSVGGEMIASMSETLEGLRPIDADPKMLLGIENRPDAIESYESGDYLVHIYGDEDRAVIYISSRSDSDISFKLDLDEYFGDYTHVWGETLTSRDDPSTGWRDESDPQSAYGVADFDVIYNYQLEGIALFQLEPYEIARISVQLSDEGVFMHDHDPLIDSGINYDDNFVGSDFNDTIIAHIGEDSIVGWGGDDVLHGGDDDDNVFGGQGNDAAFGDSGNDFVRGDSGDDWIVGGSGNDRLVGNSGDDIISGNTGDDLLFGGDGDDILSGGGGEDAATGGAGSDYFVVTSGEHLIIEDFSISDGDKVTFLGQYTDKQNLAEHITVTEPSGDEIGDLIVSAEDGSRTVFVGAANDYDTIINSVVDFTDEGRSALDLADQLNDLDPNDVGAYVDSLDSESYAESIGSADGVILFANLQADTSAALLNSLDADELTTFIEGMGGDGLNLALGEMTPEELLMFLDGVTSEVAQELVTDLGEEVLLGSITGMDEVDQIAVHDKFFPLELQEVAPLSGNILTGDEDLQEPNPSAETLDEILPHVDQAPDEVIEEEDEDSTGTIQADCFIATVAYEDGEHPDVWLLRWFRDTVMRESLLGRAMIVFYWYAGPKVAEWVSGRPKTKRLIREMLRQIVKLISLLYERPVGKQCDQPNLSDSRLIKLKS